MGFKKYCLGLLCMVSMIAVTVPAYAANDKQITSVYIRLEEEKVEPGEIPNVTFNTSSNNYQIISADPSKDHSDWEPGRKVTFNVVLEPLDGYRFSKSSLNDNISVNNGELSSKKITNSEIEAKISYLPKVTLAKPENIYFEDEYEAKWDEVQYANAYEVRIYEEDEDDGEMRQKETVKVTTEKIDLSSYVTDSTGVTFEVRAIPKNANEDKYMDPSEWASVDDVVYSDDNTAYGDFYEDRDGYKFVDENGNDVTGWQQINGKWYYFDASNKNYAACDEWKLINGYWYRFGSDNTMKTGWIKVGNWWYYLSTDEHGKLGAMVTGWYAAGPEGPWYYLDNTGHHGLPYGAMWSNANTPDGFWVDATGACYDANKSNQSSGNDIIVSGITHKYDNGTYASGWTQLDNQWYYFDPNNSNKAVVDEWLFDGTNWYRLNDKGHMVTGWVQVDNYWYYLNPTTNGVYGAVMTGWVQPNGSGTTWYYLQPNVDGRPIPLGAMYANRTTPDGYYVGASGALEE